MSLQEVIKKYVERNGNKYSFRGYRFLIITFVWRQFCLRFCSRRRFEISLNIFYLQK